MDEKKETKLNNKDPHIKQYEMEGKEITERMKRPSDAG